MLKLRRITLRLLGVGCLCLPALLHASGTYPPAPPRLRADITQNIDPEAYNLGKSIYAGRANLAAMQPVAPGERGEVRERIELIVARIPARARERIDTAQLSNSLNQEGVNALLYYLQLRFRTGEVSA